MRVNNVVTSIPQSADGGLDPDSLEDWIQRAEELSSEDDNKTDPSVSDDEDDTIDDNFHCDIKMVRTTFPMIDHHSKPFKPILDESPQQYLYYPRLNAHLPPHVEGEPRHHLTCYSEDIDCNWIIDMDCVFMELHDVKYDNRTTVNHTFIPPSYYASYVLAHPNGPIDDISDDDYSDDDYLRADLTDAEAHVRALMKDADSDEELTEADYYAHHERWIRNQRNVSDHYQEDDNTDKADSSSTDESGTGCVFHDLYPRSDSDDSIVVPCFGKHKLNQLSSTSDKQGSNPIQSISRADNQQESLPITGHLVPIATITAETVVAPPQAQPPLPIMQVEEDDENIFYESTQEWREEKHQADPNGLGHIISAYSRFGNPFEQSAYSAVYVQITSIECTPNSSAEIQTRVRRIWDIMVLDQRIYNQDPDEYPPFVFTHVCEPYQRIDTVTTDPELFSNEWTTLVNPRPMSSTDGYFGLISVQHRASITNPDLIMFNVPAFYDRWHIKDPVWLAVDAHGFNQKLWDKMTGIDEESDESSELPNNISDDSDDSSGNNRPPNRIQVAIPSASSTVTTHAANVTIVSYPNDNDDDANESSELVNYIASCRTRTGDDAECLTPTVMHLFENCVSPTRIRTYLFNGHHSCSSTEYLALRNAQGGIREMVVNDDDTVAATDTESATSGINTICQESMAISINSLTLTFKPVSVQPVNRNHCCRFSPPTIIWNEFHLRTAWFHRQMNANLTMRNRPAYYPAGLVDQHIFHHRTGIILEYVHPTDTTYPCVEQMSDTVDLYYDQLGYYRPIVPIEAEERLPLPLVIDNQDIRSHIASYVFPRAINDASRRNSYNKFRKLNETVAKATLELRQEFQFFRLQLMMQRQRIHEIQVLVQRAHNTPIVTDFSDGDLMQWYHSNFLPDRYATRKRQLEITELQEERSRYIKQRNLYPQMTQYLDEVNNKWKSLSDPTFGIRQPDHHGNTTDYKMYQPKYPFKSSPEPLFSYNDEHSCHGLSPIVQNIIQCHMMTNSTEPSKENSNDDDMLDFLNEHIFDNEFEERANLIHSNTVQFEPEPNHSPMIEETGELSIQLFHQTLDQQDANQQIAIRSSQYYVPDSQDSITSSTSSLPTVSTLTSSADTQISSSSSRKRAKPGRPPEASDADSVERDRINYQSKKDLHDQIRSVPGRNSKTFKRNQETVKAEIKRSQHQDANDTIDNQFATLELLNEFRDFKDHPLQNESHQRQHFIADARFLEREDMKERHWNDLPDDHHLRFPSGSTLDINGKYRYFRGRLNQRQPCWVSPPVPMEEDPYGNPLSIDETNELNHHTSITNQFDDTRYNPTSQFGNFYGLSDDEDAPPQRFQPDHYPIHPASVPCVEDFTGSSIAYETSIMINQMHLSSPAPRTSIRTDTPLPTTRSTSSHRIEPTLISTELVQRNVLTHDPSQLASNNFSVEAYASVRQSAMQETNHAALQISVETGTDWAQPIQPEEDYRQTQVRIDDEEYQAALTRGGHTRQQHNLVNRGFFMSQAIAVSGIQTIIRGPFDIPIDDMAVIRMRLYHNRETTGAHLALNVSTSDIAVLRHFFNSFLALEDTAEEGYALIVQRNFRLHGPRIYFPYVGRIQRRPLSELPPPHVRIMQHCPESFIEGENHWSTFANTDHSESNCEVNARHAGTELCQLKPNVTIEPGQRVTLDYGPESYRIVPPTLPTPTTPTTEFDHIDGESNTTSSLTVSGSAQTSSSTPHSGYSSNTPSGHSSTINTTREIDTPFTPTDAIVIIKPPPIPVRFKRPLVDTAVEIITLPIIAAELLQTDHAKNDLFKVVINQLQIRHTRQPTATNNSNVKSMLSDLERQYPLTHHELDLVRFSLDSGTIGDGSAFYDMRFLQYAVGDVLYPERSGMTMANGNIQGGSVTIAYLPLFGNVFFSPDLKLNLVNENLLLRLNKCFLERRAHLAVVRHQQSDKIVLVCPWFKDEGWTITWRDCRRALDILRTINNPK